ncbi:MAG TPA: aconitase family protein, partial [candidate division Zixibacteria bacterium]|nr:aconitase family protein [candidate division Zixibacteria bacterium]
VNGALPEGVTAKDLALGIIHKWGTEAGTGYVLEFAGESIRKLSMEARMTLCNMSIEFGARAGMVAPDETTFAYLDGREYSPTGAEWTAAVERWRTLATDAGAKYDKVLEFDASALEPFVTWGTTPGMSAPISGAVPTVAQAQSEQEKDSLTRALTYMGLKGGERIEEIPIQRAFIGSCTNGRLEDLRAAARVIRGHKIAKGVQLMVVPGSEKVKQQAEQEGLDRVFRDAGAEWRLPGCSMCLGMNPDILQPGERCAATSNRNFEGRQGRGGRTHLMSPAMVAAAAVAGHFTDVREWDYR